MFQRKHLIVLSVVVVVALMGALVAAVPNAPKPKEPDPLVCVGCAVPSRILTGADLSGAILTGAIMNNVP